MLPINIKQSWSQDLWDTFGAEGTIALAYFLGSAFSKEIRKKQQSFPFLQIKGKEGTGKTTLLYFLGKLYGRTDYEGFSPKRATQAARNRMLNKINNEPIVLLNSSFNKERHSSFSWDELKSAYDDNCHRSILSRDKGSEKFIFNGSIVIEGNISNNDLSPAMESRIVSVDLKNPPFDEKNQAAIHRLNNYMPHDLPCIGIHYARRNFQYYLKFFKWAEREHETYAKNARELKHRLQVISLIYTAQSVFNLDPDNVIETIETICE